LLGTADVLRNNVGTFWLFKAMGRDHSFQSLEQICRIQAAVTTNARTRQVMEQMAEEYARQAEYQEQLDKNSPEKK